MGLYNLRIVATKPFRGGFEGIRILSNGGVRILEGMLLYLSKKELGEDMGYGYYFVLRHHSLFILCLYPKSFDHVSVSYCTNHSRLRRTQLSQ